MIVTLCSPARGAFFTVARPAEGEPGDFGGIALVGDFGGSWPEGDEDADCCWRFNAAGGDALTELFSVGECCGLVLAGVVWGVSDAPLLADCSAAWSSGLAMACRDGSLTMSFGPSSGDVGGVFPSIDKKRALRIVSHNTFPTLHRCSWGRRQGLQIKHTHECSTQSRREGGHTRREAG